ncbi:MAG: hypothetical protein ACYDHX_02565 [Methanothrix sp.]
MVQDMTNTYVAVSIVWLTIVATNVGSNREVVQDGETGLYGAPKAPGLSDRGRYSPHGALRGPVEGTVLYKA